MSWRRELTVQGFNPLDQGLHKFVEFCTYLESCVTSKAEPKGEKPSTLKTAGKRKAEVSTMPAASSANIKFYCEMHGHNRTHNRKDCFELNRHAKCAKAKPNQFEKGNIAYKDLNVFVNAKVMVALKKAKKERKKRDIS
eukprot:13705658-Ditylum_brightwellii.AAC.1